MKYLKLFESFDKKILVNLDEFKLLFNKNNNLNVDDYLIILPNNKNVTFDEYIDKGYNILFPINNDHIKSPLNKHYHVPNNMGYNKKGKIDWGY